MEYPDHGSIQSLLIHGQQMRGKSIADILDSLGRTPEESNLETGKGGVGNVIQAAFGLGLDNRPEADFPDATGNGIEIPGVELKIIPLTRRSNSWKVKERQVIGMINYNNLPLENWLSSHARNKINRILNVFVTHEPQGSRSSSIVKGASLWEPDSFIHPIIENDWLKCQQMVAKGLAHELSERLFTTLSACRKGSGGEKDIVHYDHGIEPALRRAFSFKVAYMNGIWDKYRTNTESLIAFNDSNPLKAVENRLRMIEGQTMSEVVEKLGIPFPKAKDYAYRIVRHWITGGKGGRRIAELDDLGILLKTVPIRDGDLRPWEATSFPAVSIGELIQCETFENHFMAEELSSILFVPTMREKRRTPWEFIRFGRPILWQPSNKEWTIMKKEWTMFRDILRKPSGAYSLPKASDTQILHMRPKARDGKVRDSGPWGDITKQCFWLNQGFVQSLLSQRR